MLRTSTMSIRRAAYIVIDSAIDTLTMMIAVTMPAGPVS